MARQTRRNRRKRGRGVKLHAPMIAVLALAATVFISYLWLCGRCEDLGRRIRSLEQTYESCQRKVQTEESKWTRMKSPGNLQRYLVLHQLDMTWPDEDRIVRIPMHERRAFEPESLSVEFNLAKSQVEYLSD